MSDAITGFGLFDWAFFALMPGLCFLLGWRIRSTRGIGLIEHQALSADIQWLRAALADSERRCAAQAGWIADLESELVEARSGVSVKTQPPLRAGAVSRPFADLTPSASRG